MSKTFEFYNYETVTIPIRLNKEGILEDIEEIVISIVQYNQNKVVNVQQDYYYSKDSDIMSIDKNTSRINLWLSQRKTSAFAAGPVAIQVNLYYGENSKKRDTSAKGKMKVLDNLYKNYIHE